MEPQDLHPNNITAIVLCGGKGSRLSGEDKPLIQLDDRRIIDHICGRLHSQVCEIIISCSRNVGIYETIPHPLAIDEEFNVGPLAGLTQAFEQVETEWALTTPGDTPFIAIDLAKRLYESASKQGVAVPIVDGVTQNLCLLINKQRRDDLTKFHVVGGNAVKHWLKLEQIEGTPLTEIASSFLNINTPAELDSARERLSASSD